jgi:hypothetical protein
MGGDTSHHDERTRVNRIRGEVRKDSLLHGDCVRVSACIGDITLHAMHGACVFSSGARTHSRRGEALQGSAPPSCLT